MESDAAEPPLDISSSSAGSELKEVFVSPPEEQARPESSYEGLGKIVDDIDRSVIKVGDELHAELSNLVRIAKQDCALF